MKDPGRQFRQLIAAWLTTDPAMVRRALADNLLRLGWLALVVGLLNLAHVAVFFLASDAGEPVVQLWRQRLILAHGAMAALMLPMAAIVFRQLRRARRSGHGPLSWWLVGLGYAAGLGFAIAVAGIDQAVTPNITPFLVASVLGGTLLLLAPLAALMLYAGGALVFWWVMAISQADAVLRLSNQVNGLTAAGIGLLLSVMLWVKYVRHESLLAELQASRARLIAQQAELEHLAVRDGLTGLWNRAALQRMALRELALAQRHGHETAFILIDLDRFKHINDGWGHPVGDRVLLAVAQALLHGARTTDEVARLGGEEFVILLPQTGLEAATILAERLRGQVAALLCPPVTLPITASFGVAATPGWPVTPLEASYERLYAAADAALYAAKHHGRNRVEVSAATPLP